MSDEIKHVVGEDLQGEGEKERGETDSLYTLNEAGERVQQLLDEAATTQFAQQLATLLLKERCGDFKLYLHGNLGAGKTTFARYFIQSFGVEGAIKSPTYTLIEPYEVRLPEVLPEKGRGKRENSKHKLVAPQEMVTIYHADLYRLASPLELYDLGLLEESGIWLIEWPEKGEGVLPTADIELFLNREGEKLTLRLSPKSEAGAQLIAGLES